MEIWEFPAPTEQPFALTLQAHFVTENVLKVPVE